MQDTVHLFIVVGYNFDEIKIHTLKPIYSSYTAQRGWSCLFSSSLFWELQLRHALYFIHCSFTVIFRSMLLSLWLIHSKVLKVLVILRDILENNYYLGVSRTFVNNKAPNTLQHDILVKEGDRLPGGHTATYIPFFSWLFCRKNGKSQCKLGNISYFYLDLTSLEQL
jgi:hypothetical protein